MYAYNVHESEGRHVHAVPTYYEEGEAAVCVRARAEGGAGGADPRRMDDQRERQRRRVAGEDATPPDPAGGESGGRDPAWQASKGKELPVRRQGQADRDL